MDKGLPHHFSAICGELCNILYIKDYSIAKANALIDELNAHPFKTELFVRKHEATTLLTTIGLKIKPSDEFLAAKSSHLINSIVTKQNIKFDIDCLWKVISWHVQCLNKCSVLILPDILHNMQCILQCNPQAGYKFTDDLIGQHGVLLNILDPSKNHMLGTQNRLQICLIALKCIISLTAEENKTTDQLNIPSATKEHISEMVIKFLMKGATKSREEFLYSKTVISALRVLSQLYYNDKNVNIQLPDIMGICQYFVQFGIVNQNAKPERLMPSQQTIASLPAAHNARGGKKQRLRKQRNNAMESLKKEIPMSDRSLMQEVVSFDSYKPASQNYLETHKLEGWTLTSDSDISDVENSREAKLIALKSRVRQSASNLLLVLVKFREKKDFYGYWWAFLPNSPDATNWLADDAAKRTLAYCAITDPVASSRVSVLNVILALLSGSRIYLAHAESSKREITAFIPFAVSLGYTITCMHKVLVGILDTERSHAVIIVALKCCAALIQITPYRRMNEGLISDMVRSTRKFLVHRDVTLQVGALITMGCVLSVDPKVDEIIIAIEKDTVASTSTERNMNKIEGDECDDFEEGYSDDEMFTVPKKAAPTENKNHCFKSWILDICFKNLGWVFRDEKIVRCKPSAIPVVLESLQVLSAIAFQHLPELLQAHLTLLADILSETLGHEHQDVVLQAAKTISIIGDAIQKLEQAGQWPPIQDCVYMWERLLTPLSAVLQGEQNAPAKALVCDCIANIGEKSFQELPRHLQVLCCTLLVGSCSDAEPSVRAAAVRALAMAVIYRPLREDIYFVSDCGENILRALAEPTIVVRTKAGWALGNLSDALVLNMEEQDAENIDDELLVRLLEVSIHCAGDNDKVKMSATRSLGNLLRLIKSDYLLRNPQFRNLGETAIDKLLDCACRVTNMKVRWNACYGLGNAMKNQCIYTSFSGWQRKVFPSLCTISQECKNLKVRINAALALRAPATREKYAEHFPLVWRGLMLAMDSAANVDDFTEYKHKNDLIEQLCVTLAHMCCLLLPTDLPDIVDPLVFHHDCAKGFFTLLCQKLAPENASCLQILQAAKFVTVDLTASVTTLPQQQCLGILQDIFVWDM